MSNFERNVSLFAGTFNRFLTENTSVKTYKDVNYMSQLSEAEKFTVSDKLISALYKSSMQKYSMIDFGKIPDSKGDIDRVERISEIEETLKIIEQISPDIKELKAAKQTLLLLRTYKKEFSLGFIQEIPLIIMIYNTITLSLFCVISLAMNTCLDYLRTPNGNVELSSKNMYNANSQMNVVVDNLEKFIASAEKGDLKKLFDSSLKKDNFIGSMGMGMTVSVTAIAGIATVALAISIVPIIRELLYFFYNMRMSVSEFFRSQSAFLEINVTELRQSGGKSTVIKRQEARIKQLEKLANKFEVDFNNSNNKTKKELSQKINTSNVQSSLSSEKDDISAFSLL